MEPRNNDNLDHWLDRALRQYGNTEPRAGLEGRVVANLAVEAKRAQISNPSRWALATLSAAALLIFIWLGVGQHGLSGPGTITRPTTSENAGDHRVRQLKPRVALEAPVTRPSRRRRDHAMPRVSGVREPRLDRFPSARPLGQQELLFVRFAERFPEDAMLIAEEQRNFEEEIRRAEQDFRNSSPLSDKER